MPSNDSGKESENLEDPCENTLPDGLDVDTTNNGDGALVSKVSSKPVSEGPSICILMAPMSLVACAWQVADTADFEVRQPRVSRSVRYSSISPSRGSSSLVTLFCVCLLQITHGSNNLAAHWLLDGNCSANASSSAVPLNEYRDLEGFVHFGPDWVGALLVGLSVVFGVATVIMSCTKQRRVEIVQNWIDIRLCAREPLPTDSPPDDDDNDVKPTIKRVHALAAAERFSVRWGLRSQKKVQGGADNCSYFHATQAVTFPVAATANALLLFTERLLVSCVCTFVHDVARHVWIDHFSCKRIVLTDCFGPGRGDVPPQISGSLSVRYLHSQPHAHKERGSCATQPVVNRRHCFG